MEDEGFTLVRVVCRSSVVAVSDDVAQSLIPNLYFFRLLLSRPGMILTHDDDMQQTFSLDEPTNHLDLEAVRKSIDVSLFFTCGERSTRCNLLM